MKTAKVDAIYFTLMRKPWCFAVRRKLQPSHDDFELIQASSLPDLLTDLFTILSDVCPDFVDRLDCLDSERLKKSSQRSIRYFDANHVPNWRQCLPATIGRDEARAIAGLACDAARIDHKSINLPLLLVLST